MTVNVELKDYPQQGEEEWAWCSSNRAIALAYFAILYAAIKTREREKRSCDKGRKITIALRR